MAWFMGNMEPPLHQAAKSGQVQAVWQLLQRGADVNARDGYSRTALHWAAEFGHEGVARLLLENGVDIEAKGRVGWTALHCAASDGREAVVRLLLENGANIEAKENDGQTPLHWAAWNGHEAVVRLLLQKGADPEARGKNGWSALNWAAGKGHTAVVQLLSPVTRPAPNPLASPQYNPFLQTARVNPYMPQLPSVMQMPGFGYNPLAQQNTPGLGFGPTAPLANRVNMQQFIAYAGDNQLAFPSQNTAAPGNPWVSYAGS